MFSQLENDNKKMVFYTFIFFNLMKMKSELFVVIIFKRLAIESIKYIRGWLKKII